MTSLMAEKKTCPDCGAPLPADAPAGFCASCLIAAGANEATQAMEANADPASQSLAVGERMDPPLRGFGDYELLEEIARGGMGIVYKARQRSLNRMVAVKMILAGQFASKQIAQRFKAEAIAAAVLHHPNIVAVHEVGVHEGQHFFSMDFVEGQNLTQLVGNRPLLPKQAARYLKQIAEAIHYAHQQGILHRDLKPSNVLIDAATDQPRVTDFGLAKRMDGESSLTVTGQVLGSPNFMPPEQASGARGTVGRHSDVYGLGGILYFLLTARAPFQGETLEATIHQTLHAEPIAPRLLNASVPRDLETICLKCLEKEAGRRYATAHELAEELDRFLRDEPIHARPVARAERAWRWCRRKPALAASLVAVVVLVLVVAIGSPIAAFRINQARKAEQVQLRRAEANELISRQYAYDADMNVAQLAVNEGDLFRATQRLQRYRPENKSELRNLKSEIDLRGWEWHYLWNQCQGDQRHILGYHTNGATAVGVLSDGRAFSAGRDKCVRLWNLETGQPIDVLKHPEAVIGAAASPDGHWLVTVMENVRAINQPVLLWDLSEQRVAAVLATNFCRPSSLVFSPDSKLLAWVDVGHGVLHLCDVATRCEIAAMPADYSFGGPLGIAFSPDSRTLACNEDVRGLIRLWDVASKVSLGQIEGQPDAVCALAFSPDGKLLAYADRKWSACVLRLDTRQKLFSLTNRVGRFDSVVFSPDGRTLAAVGWDQQIHLIDVATGVQRAGLKGHLRSVTSVAFTPDGQTVLSASEDGTVRVWDVTPPPKTELAQPLPPDLQISWDSYGESSCLSPDGRFLLTIQTNQTFILWNTLKLTTQVHQAAPYTNTAIAAVAPGGKQIAFGTAQGEVTLWDTTTGRSEILAPSEPGELDLHRLSFSAD